jgi:hypothetical protein
MPSATRQALPAETDRARWAVLVLTIGLSSLGTPHLARAAVEPAVSPATSVDPYVAKPRILVLSDIANEPDDQMSLVRLLVYSNELDIEGLVATTSTWMKDKVRPDVILDVIDAYAKVRANLALHADGYPSTEQLRALVRAGQPTYGMAAVGKGQLSPGAALILEAAAKKDDRPLWVTIWGGANTLAQALWHARATQSPAEVQGLVDKLRVYAISDQDDAGPWIRQEFPTLRVIGTPSTQDGAEYRYATWTGISGDLFYKNAPGADFSTFTDEWVDANIRSRGPLGQHYPYPCCIHEGDTPSYLGLIDNGLSSAMSPSYGGWGGRYVWRQPHGEPRPMWTQGGDSFPGQDNSRDTVVGADGKTYTSDQATIWRWRNAFQHDFAARMAWSVFPFDKANHNPSAVVNDIPGKAPIELAAQVGVPLTLSAKASSDPDGDAIVYRWFFYPEAGTGIPGHPVATDFRSLFVPPGPGPHSGPPAVVPRLELQDGGTPTVTVLPRVAGTAHVILEVEDDGTPALTSYRRIILAIAPAPAAP